VERFGNIVTADPREIPALTDEVITPGVRVCVKTRKKPLLLVAAQ